jgi:magnesium transporter
VIAHACAVAADRADGALRMLDITTLGDRPPRLEDHAAVWIDIAEPNQHDIDWLRSTFNFHPIALEDVTRQHQRPKLDTYNDYYFGVLYAALRRPSRVGRARAGRIETRELQFFWSKSSLVTIHVLPLPEIDDLIERVKDRSLGQVAHTNGRSLQVADLAYWLIDSVVDGYFPIVDLIAEWSEDIEEDMFSPRRSSQTLQSIFTLKKDLFQLRKVLAPSREVVNMLLRREHDLFGDEFYPYFQDVYDHINRVIDSLDTYRDLLSSGLDTYLSFVSNDVNQTVKKMTAVTAILMVDALVAGIYGMNFTAMPELNWQYGYPFAVSLMLIATATLFAIFRRLRWF